MLVKYLNQEKIFHFQEDAFLWISENVKAGPLEIDGVKYNGKNSVLEMMSICSVEIYNKKSYFLTLCDALAYLNDIEQDQINIYIKNKKYSFDEKFSAISFVKKLIMPEKKIKNKKNNRDVVEIHVNGRVYKSVIYELFQANNLVDALDVSSVYKDYFFKFRNFERVTKNRDIIRNYIEELFFNYSSHFVKDNNGLSYFERDCIERARKILIKDNTYTTFKFGIDKKLLYHVAKINGKIISDVFMNIPENLEFIDSKNPSDVVDSRNPGEAVDSVDSSIEMDSTDY
jgi:hypothetical protein